MAIKLSARSYAAIRRPAAPRTPRTKPVREEAKLLRACLQLLAARGIFHLRVNSGAGMRDGRPVRSAPAGTSDVILCIGGKMIGLELKSAKGRLRASQAEWRDRLVAAGGRYWMVRDVAELDRLLREELK